MVSISRLWRLSPKFTMLEGAIFDMDGVLVNNAPYHIRAWKQLGKELGRELADDAIRAVFGQRNKEMLAALMGRNFTPEELARHTARKEIIYREMIRPHLQPVDGLPEFLADLKQEGIRTALATSGPRENVDLVLRSLHFESCFNAVVTGADVSRSKPDPEIFLLAARCLGVPAEKSVVFEDSTAGVQAARRAGCLCIAVATTHSAAELEAFSPSRIILDFRNLRAADLARIKPSI